MASAIERLMAFARSATGPLSPLDRRILAETGLPLVMVTAPDPIHVAIQGQLLPLAVGGDVSRLAAVFDQMFAAKSFTDTGYRTYRIAHEMIMATIDADGSSKSETERGVWGDLTPNLEAAARSWHRDRTDPVTASVYASALLGSGYLAPASDDGVDELDAPLALRRACGEARAVLAHAGPRGRRHWIWRQADFMLTFAAYAAGAEDEAMVMPAFAAVQTLDPHEFGIYDDRTLQLLPRWSGGFAAVDSFARAAADRTAAQFGDLLYARIYDAVLGHENPEATLVDPQRLLAGFDDWYRRFPSQPLVNRYAAYAHAFGALATLEQLFRGPLREIHPHHWLDRDQPLMAWRSISPGRHAMRGR